MPTDSPVYGADTVFDEQAALRRVVEGTASETGERFFRSLVESLQSALGTMGAWIATPQEGQRALRALSMKVREEWLDGFVYQLEGTPCETALDERRVLHIPDRVMLLYRGDPSLVHYGAVSYMGVPLFAHDGRIVGQLAVLDDKVMPAEPRYMAIFQIFANRAAAELERLEAERAVHEREARLRLLLDGAMDAIVDFDGGFRVALMNPAARRIFGCPEQSALPADVRSLLADASRQRLELCAAELSAPDSARTSQWLAGGLSARTCHGEPFHAEASLSHYRAFEHQRFTLILRNVEERLAAERRILSLTREAEYLRDELKRLEDYGHIVGSSKPLLRALQEIEQVAPTPTTVLLLGESGTGKELFARALHARSKRGDKPLVKLNCAAIPHNLIESELFGHEKGAFTGATQRRDGRFALADGGTLFLDEIGELPLELQPKLLRVLQEGELEPVGSSRTLTVDVRIVAATNRDLADAVKRGTFREDLFYRLNVFPVRIPPLREREGDVAELAQAFLEKHARKIGRSLAPLSEAALAKLRAYPWPGNVRELQNVIERGVILSTHGIFDLERALPEAQQVQQPASSAAEPERVQTVGELLALERANIERALDQSGGKVSGPRGAAALLDTHPSTLNSRMRSLGIKRSAR
jgi:PAS domain S-box-containing protein